MKEEIENDVAIDKSNSSMENACHAEKCAAAACVWGDGWQDTDGEQVVGTSMEHVYKLAGGMGTYQWCSFILIGVLSTLGTEPINMNFVGASPDHWCHIKKLENFTHMQQRYIAIPGDPHDGYDKCKMFQLNYGEYRTDELLKWNRSLMVNNSTPIVDCHNGWTYDQSQYLNTMTSRVRYST